MLILILIQCGYLCWQYWCCFCWQWWWLCWHIASDSYEKMLIILTIMLSMLMFILSACSSPLFRSLESYPHNQLTSCSTQLDYSFVQWLASGGVQLKQHSAYIKWGSMEVGAERALMLSVRIAVEIVVCLNLVGIRLIIIEVIQDALTVEKQGSFY